MATYQPRGAAMELFASRAGEILLSGPAGTGKSRACLEKINLIATRYPGMRGLICRKTRESLTQTALVTFDDEVLGPEIFGSAVRFRSQEQEYRYANGSCIVVCGLDKATKIMSSQFDVAYVQEAIELAEHDWESITTRLRNGAMPYQQLVADTNPDAPIHWLKQRCESGRCKLLESRHDDNPRVTPEYLAVLDSLSGIRRERLFLGRWSAAEGVIWEGFNRAVHVVARNDSRYGLAHGVPDDWPREWVVDFGYTNPFVWQEWAEDPDGRLFRVREIYRTQTLVEDHAREILRVTQGSPRPRRIICDHDAEDRATLERHLKMPTVAAHKAVSDGLQAVAARLRAAGDGRPRLIFLANSLVSRDSALSAAHLPICTEEEIPSYVWDTSIQGSLKEKPLKMSDHGCDASRYVVSAHDLERKKQWTIS